MNKVENIIFSEKTKDSSWRKLFLEMISKIDYGSVQIITPEGESLNFSGTKEGVHATLSIYDWAFCDLLFLKGDIGLGESYIEGHWNSSSINDLIKFGIDNQAQLERVIKGSFFKILFYRLKHFLNRNSKKGSKRNIHAHYDLGNDFYKMWLDPSMTYSSALFNKADIDLQTAQDNKYQNILNQLNLKPGDHILEVGCGWGGFMEYAAKQGVRVTGITISKEQFDFAQERLKNVEHLITIKLIDYRDLKGQYDHIVSIEMFEALGRAYWATYFTILKGLLKPDGKAIIQSITIDDNIFSHYRKGTDFIQQYIFPGGMLPSPRAFEAAANKQGLRLYNHLEFGEDYALTLKKWEEQFSVVLDSVKKMGFDEKFIRTWRFYLKYCQGGFEAKRISVYQFYLTK